MTSRLKLAHANYSQFWIRICDCAKPLGVCDCTSRGKYDLCLELFWFRVWCNDTSSVEINRHDSPVFSQPLSDPSPTRFEISMCTSLNLSRNWVTVVCWISLSLEDFSGICCPLDIRKTEKGLRVRMCARDLANSEYRGHLLSLYWAPSSSNEFEVNPKDILFEILFFDFCFLVVCDLRLMRWIYYLLVSRRQALERKKTAGMMGSSSMQERQRRVSEAMHYGVLRLKL